MKLIYSVLSVSQNLFSCQEEGETGKKTFLSGLVKEHRVWREEAHWKYWIERIISKKSNEAARRAEAEAATPRSGKNLLSFLGKKLMRKKSEDVSGGAKDRRTPKSVAFNFLSQFVYYLVNFGLAFETARDLILFFCEKYELEEEKTHLLLSELESA